MQSFIYDARSPRVMFGSGTTAAVSAETARLGIERALVLSTANQRDMADALADRLGERCVGTYCEAEMHTPVAVTKNALARAGHLNADGLVAIGGGSTIGLSKALALRTGLPQLILPTTYAGSEMTPILGQTEDGVKTTQRTFAVLPDAVIYDVDHTLSLPVAMSVNSGLNAMAHAVEALYARDGNPITALMAEESISALSGALQAIVDKPSDTLARSRALYGAYLAGTCLGTVGMALHHKLCHLLGGAFDLPHAETHAVLLPHVVAYNAAAAPDAMMRIARALGREEAAQGLHELAVKLGAPKSLSALGLPQSGIDRVAADSIGQDPYWNPAPLDRDAIAAMLARAWQGSPPLAPQSP